MSTHVLTLLHQRMPELTPTERRVAETVLADPSVVQASTITQLAAACDASPATIGRLARALGFEGYPEFRVAVAADSGRDEVGRARFQISESDVSPDDDVATTISKIAYHEAATIEQTARDLDADVLEQVVDRVASARRIDIYGFASSGLAGQDLQQKLHRVGLFAQSWSDQHLALTSASILGPDDVAIAFSHSGRTLEIVQAIEVAAATGATTVAVTNSPTSPLAGAAGLVLTTSANDSRFRSGAMSSRIAQLAVIDFLFVRVAQRGYDAVAENLRLSYEAVKTHRIE